MIKKNLAIFVFDALRYDFLPLSIRSHDTVVPTLTPSLMTPTSFASLVTGRNPQNHNVNSFSSILNPSLPTVFDFFENPCYYDHPMAAMSRYVFKNYPNEIELTEIREPFVWIERIMETHTPYGEIRHGNEHDPKWKDLSYVQFVKKHSDLLTEYKKGVKRAEEHFWRHIKELKERNILDDTLVVVTSDHGESLGEKRLFMNDLHEHTFPACVELVKVPTVFFDLDLDVEFMRTIDIVPTCLDILDRNFQKKKWDGVSVRRVKPNGGVNLLELPFLKYLSKWRNEKGEFILENKLEVLLKTLIVKYLDKLFNFIRTTVRGKRFLEQEEQLDWKEKIILFLSRNFT